MEVQSHGRLFLKGNSKSQGWTAKNKSDAMLGTLVMNVPMLDVFCSRRTYCQAQNKNSARCLHVSQRLGLDANPQSEY